MNKIKKMSIASISIAAVFMTSIFVSAAIQKDESKPNTNPWDYALLSDSGNTTLNCTLQSICVDGDIRSNHDINLVGTDFYIEGDVVASGKILEDVLIVDTGRSFTGYDAIEVSNKWDSVYSIATKNGGYSYISDYINESSLEINSTVLSDTNVNIKVLSDIVKDDSDENKGEGKTGIFGAGFMTSAYENYEKWKTILPLFNGDINIDENESGHKDVLELARKSEFIPIQEQSVSSNWDNYDKLPGAAISDNFGNDGISNYISKLKKENPVFDIENDDSVEIQSQWDNSTVNPDNANSQSIKITNGNCTLNGNYDKIEEIKLENYGGTQLIGDFPNLKYIYKTSWGNLNLAGNFPSLECIYMPGGQLLLGNADKGFTATDVTIINETGIVAVYTAQDTKITDSRIVTSQNILMRGAGKNATAAEFNVENTIMAAGGNLMFEDMNDNEMNRYENIPVFYSRNPISLIKCNFKLMQGMFMTQSGAIIMADSDIGTMRGFLAAPNGINEYQANSASGIYLDTYSYNIHPGINSLNEQPNGSERVGSINAVEYANFPVELLSNVGNAEKFVSDINSTEFDSDLGHAVSKPGVFELNSYLLATGNISVTADKLQNDQNAKSVIGSENGDISINLTEKMNYCGIIYAPNGKVTIHGSGVLNGRIYAREIEIVSDSFVINGRGINAVELGFTEDEPKPTNPSETTTTTIASTTQSENESQTTTTIVTEFATETSSAVTGTTTQPVDYNSNVKYEYDSLNRVTKAIYDEENYVEYVYDANGNITKVTIVKDGMIQN